MIWYHIIIYLILHKQYYDLRYKKLYKYIKLIKSNRNKENKRNLYILRINSIYELLLFI